MHSTEVVISRYNEDVSWLGGIQPPTMTVIYDKGPAPCEGGIPGPNVGREAETYLRHIVTNYDVLADWTAFTQADPKPHLGTVAFEGLLTPRPGNLVVPWHGTFEELDGSGNFRWAEWPEWAEYYARGEIRRAGFGYRDWAREYLDIEVKTATTYHPGAVFAVDRDTIRKRPRSFYARLLRCVSNHPHPEEAHYLERAWPLIFEAPLYALDAVRPLPAVNGEWKVYCSLPHYGDVKADALPGLMLMTDRHQFYIQRGKGSLLAFNFNDLLATCLNSRYEYRWTHHAMHHADIAADPGWLDVLLDEMDRTGADVMSTAIPIKDKRGLSTTGWMDPKTGKITRFTMKELYRLPETFDAAGAGVPDSYLMVNTGLWVFRLAEWVDDFDGFTIADKLCKVNGRWHARALSEDWFFSRWAARRGLKVFATRKVKATHFGDFGFANDGPWGECETDPGDQR